MLKHITPGAIVIFLGIIALGCTEIGTFLTLFSTEPTEKAIQSETVFESVTDTPYAPVVGWNFDEAADLQFPELPSGCEATAASTLLRMNGVNISKTEFADKMQKNNEGEFVYSFWGNPYSAYGTEGMCIMAPGIVNTICGFIPTDLTVMALNGNSLLYLPTPCIVWVTIDMKEAIPSKYSQDGYNLLLNSHSVIMTYVDDVSVSYIDPLIGPTSCGFSAFERAYKANNKQAVYICPRGY